ncbi:MAG: ribosome maturation factor RimM [Thiofilum sp.]|uniref:ribosome maturation factor RimM n=1 Tax=Thiofilum sp. TaxID=2212733 RepID=UPI0025E2C40F|nr:ribosome maturation factor RimM [Thiofilum sp.]MBK8453233.1 ribosome maturation factor RimM [Thiofilum sp.]
MSSSPQPLIVMGKIAGAYGIKGWVKVMSFTDPPEKILRYRPWHLLKEGQPQVIKVKSGKPHGKTLVAWLEGIEDRNQAELLNGYEIAIERQQLPQLTNNEYYWSDLLNLQVVNLQGIDFGRVTSLVETGANDVLIVQGERERLVPWIWEQVIKQVSLEQGVITVDWDADF